MTEHQFTSHGVKLTGSLIHPEGAEICALLLSGSGPVNRDSNLENFPLNAMKEIADFLAENNVATFRYDKRGVPPSEGAFLKASFDDNFKDADAALSYLKSQCPSQKLIIIGHSEGAIIAARLAAMRDDVDGAILLAGPAQSGKEIMKWQLGHVLDSLQGLGKWILKILPLDPKKQHQKFLDKLEKSDEEIMKVWGIKKVNAAWLRGFAAYAPMEDFPKIKCPVLAITGTKDIQVPHEDLKLMKKALKVPFESHAISDLTHVLRRDSEKPSLQHYQALMKLPLDEEMLDLIKEWVFRV